MGEAAPRRGRRPCCSPAGSTAVRSPMAAALLKQMLGSSLYVGSAGVRKGELDPFAVAAMDEIGIDISAHRPMTFEELEDLEGLNFDLIVTLSPEAHHRRSSSRARSRSRSNTGRPPIRPRSKAAASSASTPIARCAIS